jgi:fluoroquinolone resistance protein
MERVYIEDKKFEEINFSETLLAVGNYENCQFVQCNFADCNFFDIHFADCIFANCNMGMAKLGATAFKEVKFTGCKLLGLHFEHCNPFGFDVYFDNCILNLSSFYKLKLKKTVFKNCSLSEVDFTEADLSNAIFENCNLDKAIFDNTILEKTDFRSSYNYSIDPAINKIKKAKFSLAGVTGLLNKYDIEVE